MKKYSRHYRHCRFEKNGQKRRRLKRKLEQLFESRGFYRSRKGIFMGVCRGLAEHFNFNVFLSRAIVLLLFLFTGFWPVGVMYLVAGLVLKLEPVSPIRDEQDEEFYDTYTHSRQSAVQRIKRKFDNIERRIQRMEDTVTSKEFDWR